MKNKTTVCYERVLSVALGRCSWSTCMTLHCSKQFDQLYLCQACQNLPAGTLSTRARSPDKPRHNVPHVISLSSDAQPNLPWQVLLTITDYSLGNNMAKPSNPQDPPPEAHGVRTTDKKHKKKKT
jgi:hypothetical protein